MFTFIVLTRIFCFSLSQRPYYTPIEYGHDYIIITEDQISEDISEFDGGWVSVEEDVTDYTEELDEGWISLEEDIMEDIQVSKETKYYDYFFEQSMESESKENEDAKQKRNLSFKEKKFKKKGKQIKSNSSKQKADRDKSIKMDISRKLDEVKSIIGSLGDLSKADNDESTEIKSNEDDKTATRRHDHFISMAHKRKMDDYYLEDKIFYKKIADDSKNKKRTRDMKILRSTHNNRGRNKKRSR